MTLCPSRKKLVTFRVTTEEYESLKNLCIVNGIRSVSEFTRDAVLQTMNSDRNRRSGICADLVTLISALEHIDEALHDLSSRIATVLGPECKRAEANGAR